MILSLLKKILFPLIYALALTLGVYSAIEGIHINNNSGYFIGISLVILLIIVLEILANYFLRNKNLIVNMDFSDDVNELSHLANKIILPFLFYISVVVFSYYNLNTAILPFILISTFIGFTILFINIRAFFQEDIDFESKTHFVYDFFKLTIFFLLGNSIINYIQSNDIYILIEPLIIFGLSVFLSLLMAWRQGQLSYKVTRYYLLGCLLPSSIALFNSGVLHLTPLQNSFIVFFLFYLVIAIIQHKISNTLNKEILLEYFLVSAIAFTIILGTK